MYSLSNQHKLASWIYLAIIVVVALFIFKDYGISWDEPTQRGIGTAAHHYIANGDPTYMDMKDKVYGVGFELPLFYLEKTLGLKDSRDIYLFRHLINLLFFALGCFFFFRLNLKLFRNFWIAIIPALFLWLSPRIFAHSFFNSKDIPFLTMYIISFYALYNYLLKPGYRNLLILSIVGGLLVNFRIMGILFIGTSLFVMVIYGLQQMNRKFMWHVFIFLFVSSLCLYITWPFLWKDPLGGLKLSFEAMSKFPWMGQLLLNGKVMHPGEQVPLYLFTWMKITIPIVYMVSGLVGILFFLVKNLMHPVQIFSTPQRLMGWIILGTILAPIIAVVYFNSVLYDDWRQLYFIYPGFLIFAGYLLYYVSQWRQGFAKLIVLGMFIYMGFIGVQMIKLHPYEHVYFNELVSKKPNYLMNHYDQDYWGTSFYDGLKYILAHDPSDTIPIFVFHDPLPRNCMMLPEKDRKRLIFDKHMSEQRAKYYLTTFRFDYPDLIGTAHFSEIYYEIKRQNSPILRIWKH